MDLSERDFRPFVSLPQSIPRRCFSRAPIREFPQFGICFCGSFSTNRLRLFSAYARTYGSSPFSIQLRKLSVRFLFVRIEVLFVFRWLDDIDNFGSTANRMLCIRMGETPREWNRTGNVFQHQNDFLTFRSTYHIQITNLELAL